MISKINSCTNFGLESYLVRVEVDAGRGFQKTTIVGLADTAVQESKERVKSAIRASGFEFPRGTTTVNLAPASLRKEGPAFDLPIALGILEASGQLEGEKSSRYIFVGELALDGVARAVRGVLSMAMFAKNRGYEAIFVPRENVSEASLVAGIKTVAVDNLRDLAEILREGKIRAVKNRRSRAVEGVEAAVDFSEIRGQESAKRAFEIAAAGAHNILMAGTPGAGKTMLAKALPGILPAMDLVEGLEVTKIHSVAGILDADKPLMTVRPFRAPHHTASGVSLVGGGAWPRPGEISLAHRGVLFLDELPEFPRHVLENLRQPLEDGLVTVARAQGTVIFPAKFMLIAARNPCPCGYAGDNERECSCTAMQIQNYNKKISGPLLDRIDMHLRVAGVKHEDLVGMTPGESSAVIRARVAKARMRQLKRFVKLGIYANSEMDAKTMRRFCVLGGEAEKLLTAASRQMKLSARAYFRILRLARTIADLAGEADVESGHIAEALQYRQGEE